MSFRLVATAIAAAVLTASCSGAERRDPQRTTPVGGCCGDPSACAKNICAGALHCGDAQMPVSVYVCCENGSFCCTADADCEPYFHGGRCDTARSACFTTCATEDDGRCRPGFHCEGAACVEDLVTFATTACNEASDCVSRNCAVAFDPAAAGSVCAPAGQCAAGTAAYDPGYTLCSGNAFARRCDAPGAWSAPILNPAPVSAPCDAGGGAATGFMAATTCASGTDAQPHGFDAHCTSCFPYRASATGCWTAGGCANDDGRCWPGHHCSQRDGNVCVSNGTGSSCDVDSECTSGRCSSANGYTCQDKLPVDGVCARNEDCTSGWCNGARCANKKDAGATCTLSVECTSGVCSNDFDRAVTTRFCTAANTCWKSGGVPINTTLCLSGAGGSLYVRRCAASGIWLDSASYVPGLCDAGLGYNSGYTVGTCTDAVMTVTCPSCNGGAAVVGGCRQGACTPGNDATCAPSYYCNPSSACVPDVPNGTTCGNWDGMCQSGRCDGTCMDQLPNLADCDENSDCQSGNCSIGYGNLCANAGASCPFLFSWDGSAFVYETDAQGPLVGNARVNGRLGLYAPLYVVLPSLQPDLLGDYRVKLREPLPEIDFVDQVRLLVVDVPAGREVVSASAENTYNLGYANPFGLYTAMDPLPPVAATDQSGADILASLLAVDDVVAPAEGVDAPVYTFDFGRLADPSRATLLLEGWALIGTAYASPAALRSYVEVVDADGSWVKVRELGIASGDLKTMAVPLSGLFRSSTDHRVRLHVGHLANSRWVIDRVRLDVSPPADVEVVAELSPTLADLRERGSLTMRSASWSGRIRGQDDTRPVAPASLGYGAFTRTGDVAPVLRELDDTYVVMRHGDELELTFDGGLPAPAPGKRRVLVAKLSLFYKSFDESRDAEPLPFHAMSAYPYPATEAFPADLDHELYRALYNTRRYAR